MANCARMTVRLDLATRRKVKRLAAREGLSQLPEAGSPGAADSLPCARACLRGASAARGFEPRRP
jgi:hypothetical protein